MSHSNLDNNGIPLNARAESPVTEANNQRQLFIQRIRDAYVRAMRAWINISNKGVSSTWGSRAKPEYDGGKGKDGRTYKSVWEKIANALIANNCLDAEGFIIANCIPGARPPKPHQLCSDIAFVNYREYASLIDSELRFTLRSQLQQFKLENFKLRNWYPDKNKHELWHQLMLSPSTQLTALFLYCLAYSEGFHDVCRVYADGALLQYMTNPPAYQRTWGDIIPQEIITRGQALLNELRGTAR